MIKKKLIELELKNNTLESQVDILQQTLKQLEEAVKKKESAIAALKTQIQYFKVTCKGIAEKDKEIKALNMKLEKLQSIQNILNCSAHEVDQMLEQFTYQDISKLQTFISVLKRELENSIAQKRRLREKAAAKSRADAEVLIIRSKLRKLEETLKEENKRKAILQAELLEIQTEACKCDKYGKKVTAVEKKSQDEYKNSKVVPIETECTSNPNSSETLETEKDNDCIVTATDNMENTPQNIKSRGFFSMANCGIKRTSNSVTVPSILAKKLNSKNSKNLFERDQLKQRTIGSGMTFDGFGGHGKYDKFPKST
ncbi:uncharacterized protein LOC116848348 isoform X2 [Odontomachus brunneus]|nr:uncharacterized protein LOC116848348 isoform X2 [Odontomachus brunneus]